MTPPLPKELSYLDSALKELARLPLERLDEDVDVSNLEQALRGRIRNMSIREAQTRLNQDRIALEKWIENSGDFKEHGVWVIAFLGSRPGALVRHLLSPAHGVDHPTITFELPVGWTAKYFPSDIQLFRGREEMGGIWLIDPSELAFRLRDHEKREEIESRNRNPFSRMIWTKSDVRFGEWHGWKFVLNQAPAVSWKSVEYLLEVPDGAVNIKLDTDDKNFDEALFEEKIHTLRVCGK